MSIVTRLQRAVTAFNRNPIDINAVSKQLDQMIASGSLETVESKEVPRDSKLDIRKTTHDLAYASAFNSLRLMVKDLDSKTQKIPPRGYPERDNYLAEYWRIEPIMAGAVYSMVAKMQSLRWVITGKRLPAMRAAKLLSRAAHMGGYDWGGFIGSVASDFYTVNRGTFIETAKDGDPLFTPMSDIGHMDALCCTLTGNNEFPVVYSSAETGQTVRFMPGEFIHFASMISPREMDLGGGFCFVDRAYRAAKLLIGLHDYDEEKLNNLPPEGIASVTGLTMDEFQDAVTLYQAGRKRDNSLTFPQVLWLIGSQPNAAVNVSMTGFSQLPEAFNRKEVVDQYVSTLALDAGVDVREFWSLSGGGLSGSAGESEIQHLKAKGKGPGEFISTMERHINGEFPETADFNFDTQDIEEDANAAAIAKAWIDAFMPLYNLPTKGSDKQIETNADGQQVVGKANPRPDKPNGAPTLPTPMLPKVDTGGGMGSSSGGQNKQAEQVIDKEQLLRLLVDKGVLPDYMVSDERVAVTDTSVHNYWYKSLGHDDDVTQFVYEKGAIKELRPKPIVINTKPSMDLPVAELLEEDKEDKALAALQALKQQETDIYAAKRNIRGAPIPEGEVVRGNKVTAKVIHEELERWRNNDILKAYAISPEAEAKLLETL